MVSVKKSFKKIKSFKLFLLLFLMTFMILIGYNMNIKLQHSLIKISQDNFLKIIRNLII